MPHCFARRAMENSFCFCSFRPGSAGVLAGSPVRMLGFPIQPKSDGGMRDNWQSVFVMHESEPARTPNAI
jgi:hypothetical protein